MYTLDVVVRVPASLFRVDVPDNGSVYSSQHPTAWPDTAAGKMPPPHQGRACMVCQRGMAMPGPSIPELPVGLAEASAPQFNSSLCQNPIPLLHQGSHYTSCMSMTLSESVSCRTQSDAPQCLLSITLSPLELSNSFPWIIAFACQLWIDYTLA